MRSLYALTLLFVCTSLSAAELGEPISLTLHPQATEQPVLKYQLFPSEPELKEGNAAPILLRMPWEQTAFMNSAFKELDKWRTVPLNSVEWMNAEGVLPDNFYREMKRAAFRRDAQWEYPIGEQHPPHLILLPDVQGLRVFLAQGLYGKIRYHLSRGEIDQAREGVLVGLANARHMAATPFYVNQLVANYIHKTMFSAVDEMVSLPQSPNLYWALSSLPDDLLQIDRAARWESSMLLMTFPAANELDQKRTPEEWRKMADQFVEVLTEIGEFGGTQRPNEPSVLEQAVDLLSNRSDIYRLGFIPRARAELPELLGIRPEQVKEMTDEEAGVRWYLTRAIQLDQQSAALQLLPPREAFPQFIIHQAQVVEFRTKANNQDNFPNPLSTYLTFGSLKRKISALRIVEAVRHYAATHDGKLPETLDAIQGLPVPFDPVTDKPFEWTVEGQTAKLAAPALPDEILALLTPEAAKASTLVYQLQLAPAR